MTHEWHAGVLSRSSWHHLESVEELPDAETLIRRGRETGAWPTAVELEAMVTASGLEVPGRAVTATYLDGSRRCHAAMGDRYRPLAVAEWNETVRAAVAAGARPAGAFALREGGRILATFEIDGGANGIRNYLNLVDSLDGSLAHIAGGSSIRVVCANTLSAATARDGKGMAKLRHTASINTRTEALREAIEEHVKTGGEVARLYGEARQAELSRPEALDLIEQIWPTPDAKLREDKPRTATRMLNARKAAARAMNLPENNEGRTVATIWNAATWLVDRDEHGEHRPARGGADSLDSLLFGSRGREVERVREIIQVTLADGTVREVENTSPLAAEAYAAQGRALLDSMLAS